MGVKGELQRLLLVQVLLLLLLLRELVLPPSPARDLLKRNENVRFSKKKDNKKIAKLIKFKIYFQIKLAKL